ncbi:Hybrid signal transduction histidine kinase K-like protein [Hapsidospora chrysogenum ATCC 11550]|uniref:Hybrid signal transduction histidine kinase K-like protein n=1 Tax=Hapsidospora chrysogenum (strain ATCC 11550 / CBS 779.69 / DSM 880 / IAM 14645 / JCM 23072 / IMI 49137) TaxID=857340 RepID=A0A086TCB8_HAPC1|nr:Hybrid signal transduction histidine kinase K-like protein [Hapsidospora chrysogenum ATCC 11550]
MDSPLQDIGLVQLLDADPRPAFIVALAAPGAPPSRDIVYKNAALTANPTLHNALSQVPQDGSHAPFWDWVTQSRSGAHPGQPGNPVTCYCLSYLGVYWTRCVLLDRWVVMSGNDIKPSSEPPRKVRLEAPPEAGAMMLQHSEPPKTHSVDFAATVTHEENRTPPLFRVEPDPGLMLPDFMPDTEPFLYVIQSVDWDSHNLGPMDEWPLPLQQAFNQTIPDSGAIAIYWGPEYRAIYNEAFSKFCGSNHPGLLGEPILNTWPHLKEDLDKLWNSPPHLRSTKVEDESRIFVDTLQGGLEETYVKWSLSPIVENRRCVGIQHSLLEITSMRLWERRMKMLIDLGDNLVTSRDVKSYWTKTMEELERWSPEYDAPLAFIYSVNEDDESDSSRSRYDCPRTCRLAGSLGVPENHPIAPKILELRDTEDGLAPAFREAVKAQVALLVQTKDGSLPERLLDGLQWRGFGDPCQAAVILPIRPTREENIMGILFLGLNPRRPYDNDYRQFISLLNQKLTSSLASTVLLEEEQRRGRNAAAQAAYDTAMLQKKLAWQTEQANQSIQNFQAVAEFIPVGMSFVDNHGNVTFANDTWYRLTGYPMGRIDQGALLECVMPEDKPKILQAYKDLEKVDVVTFEFRIPKEGIHTAQAPPSSPGSTGGYDGRVRRHILASAKAERDENGSVVRMLTCLTDVTQQKDTAEEAVRRAQEAENLKRLAEFATVGMYDIGLDGRLLSANNSFWELSGLSRVDLAENHVEPWQTCVVEEDLPVLEETLEKLKASGRSQSAEIRLKTTWTAEDRSGNMIAAARSVLATFMPVKSSDGVIQSCTGCISDVSLQKWQLDQEKKRKEEAIESKRQQENFIDMTSHEMRNPLSAIIHCTDAIIASLSRIEELDGVPLPLSPPNPGVHTQWPDGVPSPQHEQHAPPPKQNQSDDNGRRQEARSLVKDAIDHAETIETCAQHQKRIVDDILTMSKLDSKLLAVTPCTVNPIGIVSDALKMFEVEARRVDIDLTSVVDDSYRALGHEYLDVDPSRVKQVLINLLTNALKFTKTGKVRNVTIYVKGSRDPPGRDMTTAEFIPRFRRLADEYEQPALKDRINPIYLLFEVKDTGQGLSDEEKGNLFNKFVQASAKTHVKYGGSGLGLFISRRLTELQNGAIGVASQLGQGSTFAFYVQAFVPSDKARKEAEAAAAAARMVTSSEVNGNSQGPTTQAVVKRGIRWREEQGHSKLSPASNFRVDGILIVEDNLINQHVTRRGLATRGYSVDVANHGIEALGKLKRSVGAAAATDGKMAGGFNGSQDGGNTPTRGSTHGKPIPINLVLMDVEMPVQDGLTCTRQIRELEAQGVVLCASGGRIPIIAVTANARPEQVAEAKEAGCDDVLVKPYRIPELIEKMQVVVRRLGRLSPNSPAGCD